MACGGLLMGGASAFATLAPRESPRQTQGVSRITTGARGSHPPAGFDPIAPAGDKPPVSPAGFRELTIRGTREYDFLDRQALLDARTAYVRSEATLLTGLGGREYRPSEQVFGRVESGKPWWGLIGLSFNGSGPTSIEGDSEESRFIENPYLLVAVKEVWANRVRDRDTRTPGRPIYPRPLYLGFDSAGRSGWVRYDVTTFFREGAALDYRESKDGTLQITAYNAIDLGLPFIRLDAEHSASAKVSDRVTLNPEFIHVGGSCGYPDGCNNGSPEVREFELVVQRLPAKVVARLWRLAPASPSDPPDMWFVVELL